MRASILWRRLLRVGLAAGGLLDLTLAGLALTQFATATAAGQPLPAFYLRTGAVLLAGLGCVSLLAANEPRRFSPLVWIVALERLAAAALLAAVPAAASGPGALAPLSMSHLAVGELVLGAITIFTQWRLRR